MVLIDPGEITDQLNTFRYESVRLGILDAFGWLGMFEQDLDFESLVGRDPDRVILVWV